MGRHPISAAREALDHGLASVLPEGRISRAVTFLPLDAVTDVPASSLPPEPEKVNVQRRVTDMVKDGKQLPPDCLIWFLPVISSSGHWDFLMGINPIRMALSLIIKVRYGTIPIQPP
ncbi:TPA: hypothetical protein I8I69_004341 [Salmonella enterica subsp. enterica serovar Veneziana]|nr:hypothetical protein [Salmonella enterica subsp. enterica serovar Veneziana]